MLAEIYCCACKATVNARLTSGKEVYGHRPDLYCLPFWICDTCKNFVGCHHKTVQRTTPLGNIPTLELKNARRHIHAILDPLWKGKHKKRGKLYRSISDFLGYQYHTAEIKTIDEARKIYRFIQSMKEK